jgi:hypothetical protein
MQFEDPDPARIACKEKRIVGGMPAQRNIGVEELQQYFGLPAKEVAKSLGICLTSLKKVCRNNEIHRWPYRKVTIFCEIFTNRSRRPPHFINIFVRLFMLHVECCPRSIEVSNFTRLPDAEKS